MLSGNNALKGLGDIAGIGGIGAGIGQLLFGMNNPADASMGYLSQIPQQLQQYYAPYMQAGTGALPQMQQQYQNLINNPGGMINQIGAGYQQSPGFQFALQNALQGANRGAAAGGMAGSPANQVQNMQTATGMAQQDYYNWLGKALGMYGTGLEGQAGLAQGGLQAGTNMSNQIAQALAQQAQMRYMGQLSQNQAESGAFSNIAGGLGMLAAFGGL